MKTALSAEKTGFFINRNFTLLWLGQSISILGDYIFNVTLILWIGTRIAQGQSWAPLAVSGVLVATAIPSLLIGPFAGVFVDRWNKRRTMLAMDLCCALLTLLLFVLATGSITMSPPVLLAEIYSVVFLLTICTQFFVPAAIAMLGSIVGQADFTRATGRLQATSGLATILGLSLSAPLFFGVGVQWSLLINAFSFLVSFSTILLIRPPEISPERQTEQQHNFIREFKEGLHFYAHNSGLMTILIATSLFLMSAGIVNTLNFFFITQNLHLPAAVFSYINALFGVGTIIGAILATQGAKRLGPRNMFWLSLLLTGILLMLYASSMSLVMALVIFFLLAMPNAINNTVSTPIILDVTPAPFIGRVIAVLDTTVTLVKILSMALAGYLASNVPGNLHADFFGLHVSTINMLFLVAGLLAIVGGLYALVNLKKPAKVEE